MNRKMTLLAGAISSVLSGAALADINHILISEYVDGSGSYAKNTAVELTNTGSTDYTFDDTVGLFYSSYKNQVLVAGSGDGQGKGNGTSILTGKTIPAGKSLVIVNGDATAELTDYVEQNGGILLKTGNWTTDKYDSLNFNGGEAVWIGSKDAPLDIIGENSNNWGADVTYKRVNTAMTQNAAFVEANWAAEAVDTFADLGKPTFVEPPAPPTPPTEVTLAEVQGSGNVLAIDRERTWQRS